MNLKSYSYNYKALQFKASIESVHAYFKYFDSFKSYIFYYYNLITYFFLASIQNNLILMYISSDKLLNLYLVRWLFTI